MGSEAFPSSFPEPAARRAGTELAPLRDGFAQDPTSGGGLSQLAVLAGGEPISQALHARRDGCRGFAGPYPSAPLDEHAVQLGAPAEPARRP
jgi:hypothetical protein